MALRLAAHRVVDGGPCPASRRHYRGAMDVPDSQPAVCHLCETPLADPSARCPACGMHPARDLTPAAKWRVAAGLVALYVFVAVVLVLTR